MSSGKRKIKKLSDRLKETRKKLGLSPNEMAFLLGMAYQTYSGHERGEWDDTYSIRKDQLLAKLVYIRREIEERIVFLKTVMEKAEKI